MFNIFMNAIRMFNRENLVCEHHRSRSRPIHILPLLPPPPLHKAGYMGLNLQFAGQSQINLVAITQGLCSRKISKVADLRQFARGMLTLAKLFAKCAVKP